LTCSYIDCLRYNLINLISKFLNIKTLYMAVDFRNHFKIGEFSRF